MMKPQADWIQKSIDSCRKAVTALPKDIADAARRSGIADTLERDAEFERRKNSN